MAIGLNRLRCCRARWASNRTSPAAAARPACTAECRLSLWLGAWACRRGGSGSRRRAAGKNLRQRQSDRGQPAGVQERSPCDRSRSIRQGSHFFAHPDLTQALVNVVGYATVGDSWESTCGGRRIPLGTVPGSWPGCYAYWGSPGLLLENLVNRPAMQRNQVQSTGTPMNRRLFLRVGGGLAIAGSVVPHLACGTTRAASRESAVVHSGLPARRSPTSRYVGSEAGGAGRDSRAVQAHCHGNSRTNHLRTLAAACTAIESLCARAISESQQP